MLTPQRGSAKSLENHDLPDKELSEFIQYSSQRNCLILDDRKVYLEGSLDFLLSRKNLFLYNFFILSYLAHQKVERPSFLVEHTINFIRYIEKNGIVLFLKGLLVLEKIKYVKL